VQVTIALIGLAGVLGAAVLSNWDKLGLSHAASPGSGAAPGAGAQPDGSVAAADQYADAQRNAYGAATSALDQVADKIAASSTPDISGAWRSPEGYVFQIAQKADSYSYQEFENGVLAGGGEGRLDGLKVHHSYTSPRNGIQYADCSGDVAPDTQWISVSCLDKMSGKSWSLRVER
jgi:hypothetical protein